MQVQMADAVGLQRDKPKTSLNSVPESTNTNKGYKELCIEGLNRIRGVINPPQKQPPTSEPQNTASNSQIDDNTTKDQSQLPPVSDSFFYLFVGRNILTEIR